MPYACPNSRSRRRSHRSQGFCRGSVKPPDVEEQSQVRPHAGGGYPRLVHQLSAEGSTVLGNMSTSGQRPRVLRDAVHTGRIPADDLPELIAFAWLRDDSPTADISETDWLGIFATAGFFSYPPGRHRPTRPITLYRGARPDWKLRMSWAETRDLALLLGRRHAWFSPAALYAATVEPSCVLAYLGRAGEGLTVVIDPAGIERIWLVEQIPDPRP